MTNQILKPILVGLIIGAALYYLPFFFVGKAFFILLILFFFFGFFRHRRYRGPYGWNYADKIRSMSDEEYDQFKANFGRGCHYQNQTEETSNK